MDGEYNILFQETNDKRRDSKGNPLSPCTVHLKVHFSTKREHALQPFPLKTLNLGAIQ